MMTGELESDYATVTGELNYRPTSDAAHVVKGGGDRRRKKHFLERFSARGTSTSGRGDPPELESDCATPRGWSEHASIVENEDDLPDRLYFDRKEDAGHGLRRHRHPGHDRLRPRTNDGPDPTTNIGSDPYEISAVASAGRITQDHTIETRTGDVSTIET